MVQSGRGNEKKMVCKKKSPTVLRTFYFFTETLIFFPFYLVRDMSHKSVHNLFFIILF